MSLRVAVAAGLVFLALSGCASVQGDEDSAAPTLSQVYYDIGHRKGHDFAMDAISRGATQAHLERIAVSTCTDHFDDDSHTSDTDRQQVIVGCIDGIVGKD